MLYLLLSMKAKFKNIMYDILITDHALGRMVERGVSEDLIVDLIENGQLKQKPQNSKAFWIFNHIPDRTDNFVCISIVTEAKVLVIKTVLINWRPT